jgi:hypothetical protein
VPAPRQPSFLQPEQEDDLETTCARAQEIEHGDAPGVARRGAPHLGSLERRDQFLRRDRTLELAPAAQLAEQAHDGVVRANVVAGELVRRRRLQAVGGAEHRTGQLRHAVEGRRRRA